MAWERSNRGDVGGSGGGGLESPLGRVIPRDGSKETDVDNDGEETWDQQKDEAQDEAHLVTERCVHTG